MPACHRVVYLGEGTEELVVILRSNSQAGVTDGEGKGSLGPRTARARGGCVDRDLNLARVRELDRVGEEVDEHLPEPSRVRLDDLRYSGVDPMKQVDVLGGGAAGQELEGLLDALANIAVLKLELELARLDPGEVEDIAGELDQGLRAHADRLDILALLRVEGRVR